MRWNAGMCAGLCLVTAIFAGNARAAGPPKNVIFFIGDGMGKEAIKAGGYYKGAALAMQNAFPYTNSISTHAANATVTDSAAAATALATGVKVNNLAISQRLPGDGSDLLTLLEIYKAAGKSTGLVTTRFMTDATPACFAAHTSTRYDTTTIANDYLNDVRPNLLLGGGGNNLSSAAAQTAGYTVVVDRATLQAVNVSNVTHVCGIFGSDSLPYEINGMGTLPHLTEMTDTALAMMGQNTNGFFLMIEGGLIDIAGHGNDIATQVRETLEFDRCIEKALLWASNRTDTLILVTADHECGGLTNVINNGASNTPSATWTSTGHTEKPVVALAWGDRAADVSNVTDNTHFFYMVMDEEVPVPVDYDESNRVTTVAGWRYFKGTQEPPGSSNAWRTIGYTNDSAWPTGSMPFRYGDGSTGTLLSDMQNNYYTLYARQAFVLSNAAIIGTLKFGIDYDDAAIVWINGQQVYASTSAPVSTAYNTPAALSHESTLGGGGPAETNALTNVTYLVTGTNVIAIQGFNQALTSSDFVLDAHLFIRSLTMAAAGGQWSWFPGTNNPPGGTSAWRQVGYDASAWPTGGMPIRYGDGSGGIHLTNMFSQYSTVFARREVIVTNLDDAALILLTVDFDDGFALWLNGLELLQVNAPSNRSYNSLATLSHESSASVDGSIDAVLDNTYTNMGLILAGTNILAVMGFNSGTNSSDFYLNVELLLARQPVEDLDEDGMDDDWERTHFGTTVVTSGGALDFDDDGFPDLFEYRAGTSPTNSASALEFTGTASTGALRVISWQSASNRSYVVLMTTNFSAGWSVLAPTNITATPPINVYTDAASTNFMRFYRVRLNE